MANELVPLTEEEMLADAKEMAAQEHAPGLEFIKASKGKLVLGDTKVTELRAVFLDAVYENGYYAGTYDPNESSPPDCFAIGRDEGQMAPAEGAPKPQSETCGECPMNVFGSAAVGKGKACKNRRRLALILEEDMHDIPNARILFLRTPPTSGGAWATYVKKLASAGRPTYATVTTLKIEEHAAFQFVLKFFAAEMIADMHVVAQLRAKRDEAQALISTMPSARAEEPADTGPKKKEKF